MDVLSNLTLLSHPSFCGALGTGGWPRAGPVQTRLGLCGAHS